MPVLFFFISKLDPLGLNVVPFVAWGKLKSYRFFVA